MYQWRRIWLFSAVALGLMPAFAQASRLDDLVAALAGDDDQARSLARQLLPREGVQAVTRLLPLLRQEKKAVSEAAFQVLADLANEAAAPGRAADRVAVTAQLMTLLETGQPVEIKLRGLRLLPIVIPPDGDVGRGRGPLERPRPPGTGPRGARGDRKLRKQDRLAATPGPGGPGPRVRLRPAQLAGPAS